MSNETTTSWGENMKALFLNSYNQTIVEVELSDPNVYHTGFAVMRNKYLLSIDAQPQVIELDGVDYIVWYDGEGLLNDETTEFFKGEDWTQWIAGNAIVLNVDMANYGDCDLRDCTMTVEQAEAHFSFKKFEANDPERPQPFMEFVGF